MKLSPEVLAAILEFPAHNESLPPASGVAFHSGRVQPGDAFFALAGANTHGIRFADAALAAGAAYVVSDRAHPQGIRVPDAAAALLALGRHARKQWTAPVVGVTGSAGKTSTKEVLTAALDARSSQGNFNTPLALAETLVEAWLDEATGRPLVLEMGIDRPGEMAQLAALGDPDAGILTLVGASHLDGLGSVEHVAREKSVLLETARRRFASVQAHGWLTAELQATTTTYGLAPANADVVGTVTARSAEGQDIRVNDTTFSLPHLSRAAAENAVGAFAVAVALGASPDLAAARLASARMPEGRLQPRRWGDGMVLDDTYNSNPASAANALEALRACPGPHLAVLGDMLELGDRSTELHRELGAATRGLDRVFAFGPESEALAATNPHAEHFTDFDALAQALSDLPRRGTILVKGSRGMALERAVAVLLQGVDA